MQGSSGIDLLKFRPMFANRHLRRLAACLAGFAILFAALAPSVSHTLASAHDTDGPTVWTEICTALGIELVEVDGDGKPQSLADKHNPHFEHCPFCQSHASTGLPPSGSAGLAIAEGMQRAPRLFYHSPHPLFAWRGAQPRAPPALS